MEKKPTFENALKAEALKAASEAFLDVEKVMGEAERRVEQRIIPIRENILKRYPVAFILLVTFGVTATAYGIEKFIEQFYFLNNNPWLILTLGISTLMLTGTVYKNFN